jgi:uncharacterized OsmC-like protein
MKRRRQVMKARINPVAVQQPTVLNGISVDQVLGVIDTIENDPAFASAKFRIKNKWIDGGLTSSRIKEFYAACEEDTTRDEAFIVDSDEPLIMAGGDSVPNPMEYLLHALAGCLTSTLVYHSAVRGIEITAIESELEGDLDLRGLFGLSDKVRKSFYNVRVKMRVRSRASTEELAELALFSPVYETVSKSLPVDLVIEKF